MIKFLLWLFSIIPVISSQTPLPTQQPMVPAACLLTLPQNPLSAIGLSTPFILQGLQANQPCTMANTMTTTFVEAIIFNPDTNSSFSILYETVPFL